MSALAADLQRDGEPLHLLVNNAGVMALERSETTEGHDLGFATNTLATFALTSLLAPLLALSPQSRVVIVSSGGM